ncbi:hypothetical protein GCM10010975_20920 [Comamonas phosphati]|nr:hypothetical protein GCM10010975_20920 [Comamonas phosphati]
MRPLTSLFVAMVVAAGSAAAMAQSVPQPSGDGMAASARSRAEVLADLEMFQRSGLGYLPSPTGYVESGQSAEYRVAYAEYQRLLAGPAYREAVTRYESLRVSGK